VIDWSEFAALYNGFVSVEHEDADLGAAEGMEAAVEHLRSQA
jgi:sugar phosphate isomerase/epimerase